jgi:hypothetical protein
MSSAPVQPPAPPPDRNNAVWWILGIIGGGIVLMCILGLVIASTFLRRVNIRDTGNRVDIQTPVGEIKVNKDELHPTGLPAYPGATKSNDSKGGSADISFGGEGLGLAVEAYDSTDSLDTVKDWYRSRLGPSFRLEIGKDERAAFDRAHFDVNDQDLAFVDDHGDGARLVALKKTGDGVKITLLRVGRREAQ